MVEEFQKLKDFKTELNEGYFDAFYTDFDDWKKKVTKAFPNLDLSNIISVEAEDQTIEAEGSTEATNKPDIELDAVDEIVTEIMAKAELVINKVVKAFGAGLAGAFKQNQDLLYVLRLGLTSINKLFK